MLISSADVSKDELLDFILRLGGEETPSRGLFGRISKGECHLWVGLSTDEMHSNIEDEGERYVAALTELLGGPPRSQITVEISRTEGSEVIALEFALSFSARWPSVVDNLAGDPRKRHLLTRDALLRCRAAGGNIRYFAPASPIHPM